MSDEPPDRSEAALPPLRSSINRTYLYTFPLTIIVALITLYVESLYSRTVVFPHEALGMMLFLFTMVAVFGGLYSLIFNGIFVSIAWFLIDRWGGSHWQNFVIAVGTTSVGGVLTWRIFSDGSDGERLVRSMALISLVSAPLYGIVLSEVVLRKSNA